jgi:hypothetical protein
MKAAFQYKFEKFQLLKQKNDVLVKIDEQEKLFKDYTNHELKITYARVYYAATRINALVRGFLDRIICRRLHLRRRATSLIQKVMKGKLGRIRWRKEYWRSLSIVKSDNALKEIIERSVLIREKMIKLKKGKNHWKEYYDPLTTSFWYFNEITKQNTWQIPLCFQTKLICHWSGYDSYGGLSAPMNVPSQTFLSSLKASDYTSLPHIPCRCVFSTVREYYNHLETSHSWFCVACFSKNPGLSFPGCLLCGNTYNDQGINGEVILKENIEKLTQQLQDFIEKDFTNSSKESGINASYLQETIPYHIRDRLIEIAGERKEMLDAIQELLYTQKIQQQLHGGSGGSVGSSSSTKEQLQHLKDEYVKKMTVTFSKKQERAHLITNALSATVLSKEVEHNDKNKSLKLPLIPQNKLSRSQSSSNLPPPSSSEGKKGSLLRKPSKLTRSLTRTGSINSLSIPGTPAFRERDEDEQEKNIEEKEIDYYSSLNPSFPSELMKTSVVQKAKQKQWLSDGGVVGEEEQNRDLITKGIFSEHDFNIITSIYDESSYADWQLELMSDDEEDHVDDDSSAVSSIQQHQSNNVVVSKVEKKEKKEEFEKMFVCQEFLSHRCTVTTCASAHPGIRDKAKIHHKSFRNNDGRGRTRIPYVHICPHFTSVLSSSVGLSGSASSASSIPVCSNGMKCTYYHPYIRPDTKDIILALYPIESGHKMKYFTNGAKFIGNVRGNMFNGYGKMIWPDQSIYMGDWKNNEKHGYGIYHNANRSIEYIGQFFEGKKSGWGLLKNAIGDEYVGKLTVYCLPCWFVSVAIPGSSYFTCIARPFFSFSP